MTLSRAELAAMPRTTPTELAEAAYTAGRTARAAGEARVPALRSIYKPTMEQKLLRKIGEASVAMLEQSRLPADEVVMVSMLLQSDLLKRFPQDEMAILEKWDYAWARDAVFVNLASGENRRFELPTTIPVPRGATTDFSADPVKAGFPVPEATAEFFQRVDEVERARSAMRWKLGVWPGQFKNNAKRWPRWQEIADAWPLIAQWFAAQAAGASA